MSQAGVSANRLELLQIADAVAREKSIDREVVITAMEDAIQKAAKSRYGSENEIKAEVDPKTGEISLARLLEVVEDVTMEATQISLDEARRKNPAAQVGDFIAEPLPPLDFGRVAAQNAKQVIVQKVREAERERQYDEYKDRVGEIVNGIVKRVEYGNVIVDLGRAEAASALTSTTSAANSEARRFSFRARIPNSWPSCSRRKCPRFTKASSLSSRWRAIPAAAPRSRWCRAILPSIRSALASACAAAACKPW
jgi:N utilization substance protein A